MDCRVECVCWGLLLMYLSSGRWKLTTHTISHSCVCVCVCETTWGKLRLHCLMRCENAADRERLRLRLRVLPEFLKLPNWKLFKVQNKKFYRNASRAYCIGNRVAIEVIQSFSLIAFITTKDIVAIKASIKDAQLLYSYGFLKDFQKLITMFKIFKVYGFFFMFLPQDGFVIKILEI